MIPAPASAGTSGLVGRAAGSGAAVLAALLLGGQVAAASAGAVDSSAGSPGFCPDDDGVTVVVDFQDLGGTTLVRCAPGSQTRTGLQALRDAGFQVDGVQRWGEGFVCRIESRPSATERLRVQGAEDYREACVDTPPASAFWGYWQAEEGGSWQYSQTGVKNSAAAPGSFQGWSFSLNARGNAAPAPGVAPERPGGPDSVNGSGERWSGGRESADAAEPSATGSVWSSVAGLGAVAGVAALAAALAVRRRRHPSEAPPA